MSRDAGMTIRVSYIVKGLYLQDALNAERVMILDTGVTVQVSCTTEGLHLPCGWLPGTFSLYGVSETWPRYWHDYSSQLYRWRTALSCG